MAWLALPGVGRMVCETHKEKPKQSTHFLAAAIPSSRGEDGNFLATVSSRIQRGGVVGDTL